MVGIYPQQTRFGLDFLRPFVSYVREFLRTVRAKEIALRVASMSRGAAGKLLEALKTNGNFCNMTRYEIGGNASQFFV
jgi:hypothetical protein